MCILCIIAEAMDPQRMHHGLSIVDSNHVVTRGYIGPEPMAKILKNHDFNEIEAWAVIKYWINRDPSKR